jgi:hypothetical protein
MDIAYRGWRRATPGSVINAVPHKMIYAHLSSSGIKERHSRFIDMDPSLTMDIARLEVVEALKLRGCVLDPATGSTSSTASGMTGDRIKGTLVTCRPPLMQKPQAHPKATGNRRDIRAWLGALCRDPGVFLRLSSAIGPLWPQHFVRN